jgi:hypothetical protein
MPVRQPLLKKTAKWRARATEATPHHCGAITRAEPARVGAMALGDEPVDPEEEPRLVGGGDAGLIQRADRLQAAHAGRPGDRLQPEVADALVERVGRVVVGRGHHRVQEPAFAGAERARGGAPEHGDQQHRLGHARGAELRIGVATVDLAVLGHERERDAPRPARGEAPRLGDAAVRHQRRPATAGGLLIAVAAAREREGGGGEDRALRRACS